MLFSFKLVYSFSALESSLYMPFSCIYWMMFFSKACSFFFTQQLVFLDLNDYSDQRSFIEEILFYQNRLLQNRLCYTSVV